ncbi:MAG: trigger factor [Clostridia bacterium]|nr:trigger factor [Clostridia bacterium]
MSELIKVENGKATLALNIPKEDYVSALESAYRRLGHKYRVPGFRAGKAPRKVIEQNYGMDAFWDNELDACVQKAYSDAISEHGLAPELQPNIEFTEVSEETGVSLTAEVVLRPIVTLGQYKGIEAPAIEYNVSDEEVDAEILKRRQAVSTMESVDRPVEDGDEVAFDFAGYLDGEQFEGGSAENFSLRIGSHTFIPGFEEQMVGMTVGEERDLNVTFPEDYQAENLAGKPVVFKVKVHSISVEKIPELDDEFVKDTSEFDTVDEYRAAVRKELEDAAEERAKNERINAIVQKAVDNAEVEIHEDIIDEEVHAQIHRFENQLRQLGTTLEGYLEYAQLSMDDLHRDYEEAAKRNLKAQYVLFAIIDEEKLEPSDEDFIAAIKRSDAARREHWDDEKIAAELEKNRFRYASQALNEALIRFLVENSVEAKAD